MAYFHFSFLLFNITHNAEYVNQSVCACHKLHTAIVQDNIKYTPRTASYKARMFAFHQE